MHDAILIAWGALIGWAAATWRVRKPTPEHKWGVWYCRNLNESLFDAKMAGHGFRATNTTTVEHDGYEIETRILVRKLNA